MNSLLTALLEQALPYEICNGDPGSPCHGGSEEIRPDLHPCYALDDRAKTKIAQSNHQSCAVDSTLDRALACFSPEFRARYRACSPDEEGSAEDKAKWKFPDSMIKPSAAAPIVLRTPFHAFYD